MPVGGGKFQEFAYSSDATNAIDFVMDVNGKTGPNREADIKGNYYDIRSFKVATFTPQACPGGLIVAQNYCIVELGMDYEPYNCLTRPKGATYCIGGNTTPNHYWAGANYACNELGMGLPSHDQLRYLNGLHISGWDFLKYTATHIHPNGGTYAVLGPKYTDKTPSQQSPVLCIKQL